MKTQISRDTFRQGQRYSGVYQQQGRMLTDADWNELAELIKDRLNETIHDAVGSGAPRDRGFSVLDHFRLQPGYLYVDGIVARLIGEGAVSFHDQPDFSEAQELPLPGDLTPASYRLYADVWERPVGSLEDAALLDPGLHGADTCTRTRTMLQVKWCEVEVDPEDPGVNPPRGDAPLTVSLWRATSGADPCDPCAAEVALDSRVGNYLFRLEVHDVQRNADGTARLTLKWSSENGAEQHAVEGLPAGFTQGDWVYEFFSLACEENLGVHLAPWFTPSRGQLVKGYPAAAPAGKPWVRRWDGSCVLQRSGAGDWSLASGSDKGVDLSTGLGSQAHGYAAVGDELTLNLDAMALSLGLAGRSFVAGDFWLAPVREAAQKPGDTLLSDAPPHGILHHYLVLAEVTADGTVVPPKDDADRRRMEFPPLSDLWAKDVGYDSERCGSGAENVQEALDWLCAQRDLRFHNKHLHGWGIVCGLQVECGPDTCKATSEEGGRRRQVTIRKGYAIDCEGNDIVLDDSIDSDLLALVETHDAGNPSDPIVKGGSGTASLTIARDERGKPTLGVEKYDPKHDAWGGILDGTLWMDFYKDCVQNLIDAVKDELVADPEEKSALVGPTARRWTALINLFVQLLNKGNGRFVHISAKEHEILKKFYQRLQQLLQSKTFCAMFEGENFPDYPFPESRLSTIFGKGFHTRIRLTPDGKRGYTCRGNDATINVYDLAKEELVTVIAMPAGEGACVTDAAFPPDGSALYAIARLASGDTVLGVADIDSAGAHLWRPVRVLCGVKLLSLALDREGTRLYAVGLGSGLYQFDPKTLLSETGRPEPWYSFNASGQFSFDEASGRGYAGANQAGTAPSSTYSHLVRMDLTVSGSKLAPQESIPLHRPGTDIAMVGIDELLLVGGKGSGRERLCFVTRPWDAADENNHLQVLSRDNAGGAQEAMSFDLPKTRSVLAWNPKAKRLLVALEDSYCLQCIDLEKGEVTTVRHPLQLAPVSLACGSKGALTYALNCVSNTISVVPLEELETDTAYVTRLADYREEAIAAYWQLAGGVLQYLKDCFCHHLLVRCHECGDDDKVYLGGVQIKEGEVYKICNFSRRRYVKSFPTVEYWLSLIPVLPLVKKGVEWFCCLVLPDLFQKYYSTHVKSAESPVASFKTMGANRVQSADLREGIKLWQGATPKKLWDAEKSGLASYARLFGNSVINRVDPATMFKPGLDRTLVLNASVSDARQRLESQDIQVEEVKAYDRATDANLALFRGAPSRIEPGSKVTLYEENGKVLYYSVAGDYAATGVSADVKAEIDALERRKAALRDMTDVAAEFAAFEARRADLANLAASRDELAGLQQQKGALQEDVAGLKAELSGLQAQRAQLSDVAAVTSQLEAARTQFEALRQASEAEAAAVATLETRRNELEAALAGSRTELDALVTRQRQVVVEINRMQPVTSLEGVDAATAKFLSDAGITTVGDLAAAKATVLTRARIESATASRLIEAAQQRLVMR